MLHKHLVYYTLLYCSNLLDGWSPHLLIVFMRRKPLCRLIEVSPKPCGNPALHTKKAIFTILLDYFLCNTAGSYETRSNLGTWKLIPNCLGIFPDLIFRQHSKPPVILDSVVWYLDIQGKTDKSRTLRPTLAN
jgi:hypothetical protein